MCVVLLLILIFPLGFLRFGLHVCMIYAFFSLFVCVYVCVPRYSVLPYLSIFGDCLPFRYMYICLYLFIYDYYTLEYCSISRNQR